MPVFYIVYESTVKLIKPIRTQNANVSGLSIVTKEKKKIVETGMSFERVKRIIHFATVVPIAKNTQNEDFTQKE